MDWRKRYTEKEEGPDAFLRKALKDIMEARMSHREERNFIGGQWE